MSASSRTHRLSSLRVGARGRIASIASADGSGLPERLTALGVTPGAAVTVLQRFPSHVFLCDQTELAVERAVARCILVDTE